MGCSRRGSSKHEGSKTLTPACLREIQPSCGGLGVALYLAGVDVPQYSLVAGEDGRTKEATRMPRHGLQRTQEQRQKRRQRNERAFLFTPEGRLLREVERLEWEIALVDDGGDVASAATACGLTDIPKGTKALWGQSAAEAWATYRHWQKQRPHT